MTPIRILILAILLYLAYRVLRNMGRDNARKEFEERTRREQDAKVQDVLVEDPVCHKLVPKNQAVRLRQDGKEYYFCSDACCNEFTGTTGESDQ